MKIGYIFVPVMILALLISGCQQGTETTPRKLTSYVGGVDGLSIKFADDAPPDEVFDNSETPFSIALQITNEGEYTIKSGGIIASLSGINQNDFSLASLHKKSTFDLDRKYSDRVGATDVLEFGESKYKIDQSSDFSTKIIADVCYNYRTVAATAICLKKDTRQYKTADACAINNKNILFENSGAPIQISDVKESSSGSNRIKLDFVIENKNLQGSFYKPGTFKDKCMPSSNEARNGKDTVFVEVTDSAKRLNFKCSALGDDNKGETKLYDNKKQVSCILDTTGMQDTAFEQLVDITVDYVYRGAVEKPITIKNAEVF